MNRNEAGDSMSSGKEAKNDCKLCQAITLSQKKGTRFLTYGKGTHKFKSSPWGSIALPEKISHFLYNEIVLKVALYIKK